MATSKSTDNVIPFRDADGSGPPPRPPVEPMGPQMAAFFLRGVCGRLDRLQSTLTLLQKNLKAGHDAWSLSQLAGLCSDEAGEIYAGFLVPVVKGLEANSEPDAADGAS
jgi:hypothetical protein